LVLLYLETESEPASETSCFFKNNRQTMDKVNKERDCVSEYFTSVCASCIQISIVVVDPNMGLVSVISNVLCTVPENTK